MKALSQQKILILDCQTTGMHPNKAHLLQIGWSIFDPQNKQIPPIESWTLQLLNQEQISNKIINIHCLF